MNTIPTLSHLNLSVVGLGAVKLGRTARLKYPTSFALPSDDEVISLLRHASLVGVNWIDSAFAYGTANARLGQLLPQIPDCKFNICTKVGERFDGEVSTFCFDRASMEKDVYESLESLGRSSVEILLLHLPSGANEEDSYCRGRDVLLDAKARGLAALVGASVHSASLLKRSIHDMDLAMVDVKLASDKSVLDGLPPKTILVKKPFGNGRLLQPYGPHTVTTALGASLGQPAVAAVTVGTISEVHLTEVMEATRARLC